MTMKLKEINSKDNLMEYHTLNRDLYAYFKKCLSVCITLHIMCSS